MKEQMMNIANEMVKNGYYLGEETVEQFVNRMYESGITAGELADWHVNFMRAKGLI